jgi:hypothetical protein
MFNLAILDTAIGMTFVYLVLSLICSGILELGAAIFNLRAHNLEEGIRSLFSDGWGPGGDAFVKLIYDHGLVAGLYRDPAVDLVPAGDHKYKSPTKGGARELPSYIPSETFALALIGILNQANKVGDEVFPEVRSTVLALPDSKAKQALLAMISDAGTSIDRLRQNIEDWYNAAMDRVAGWYKKKSQYTLLAIGFVVAVMANADSIQLAKTLYLDPGIRSATVEAATTYLKNAPSNDPSCVAAEQKSTGPFTHDLSCLQQRMKQVTDTESATLLPLGWKQGVHWSALMILGWLLTAIALSLGAPFWFDLLNKFMVVRSTIKPQEKGAPEKSKD